MSKVVIIGAGAMGSAFAVPCADNSNEVYLVGSYLEDKVIEEINSNKNFHPVLKCQLPETVKVIKFSEFNEEIGKRLLRYKVFFPSKFLLSSCPLFTHSMSRTRSSSVMYSYRSDDDRSVFSKFALWISSTLSIFECLVSIERC